MRTYRRLIAGILLSLLPLAGSCSGEQAPSKPGVKPGGKQASDTTAVIVEGKKLITGSVKEIGPDIFGFNTQSIKGPGWTDNEFINRIAEINPSNFRYPGGTVGNFWDWRTGYYNSVGQQVNVIGTSKIYPYKIENVKTVYDRTGAMPIYMLNVLTATLDDQLEMLKHARDIGLPVKYVEMGNEYYLDDHPENHPYTGVFPTTESYADTCRRWTQAIHKEFPDAEIALVGVCTPSSWKKARANAWNGEMMNTMDGIVADAFTIHTYPKIAYEGTAYDMISNALNGVAEKKILDSSINSKYKLWVTEYNFESGSNPFPGQWVHGLTATLMSAELICIPRVELICFFNLTAGKQASAIFDSSYQIAGSTAPKNSLSATGEGLKMLSKAQKGASSVTRMRIDGCPTVKTTKNGALNGIFAYLFDGGGGSRLLVVNITPDPQDISLEGLKFTPAHIDQTFTGDILKAVAGSSSLTHQTKSVDGKAVTLRPYSISIIY